MKLLRLHDGWIFPMLFLSILSIVMLRIILLVEKILILKWHHWLRKKSMIHICFSLNLDFIFLREILKSKLLLLNIWLFLYLISLRTKLLLRLEVMTIIWRERCKIVLISEVLFIISWRRWKLIFFFWDLWRILIITRYCSWNIRISYKGALWRCTEWGLIKLLWNKNFIFYIFKTDTIWFRWNWTFYCCFIFRKTTIGFT